MNESHEKCWLDRIRTPRLDSRQKSSDWRLNACHLSPAFGVKRIINDELALQNCGIAQAQRTEAKSQPAQTFACRMGSGRMRVGGPDDFTQQHERGSVSWYFLRMELNDTSSP